MQAMILAAGYGTRLKPYTHIKPKPLFPILNIPLLILTIKRLKKAGFSKIIVNCHHLKEQIIECVGNIPGVQLQEEESILGTGGGLRRALSLLDNHPLLVTNGDIYHDIDYKKIYAYHQESDASVTFAVHDYPRFNSLVVKSQLVREFSQRGKGPNLLAFTGLHVLDPTVLEPIVDGVESCIIQRYKNFLTRNGKIGVMRSDACHWTDMGTVNDYLQLHEDILLGKVSCWQELGNKIEEGCFVDPEAHIDETVEINNWASIGKAIIGKNVKISRSVIWDGVVIPDNSLVENQLIG